MALVFNTISEALNFIDSFDGCGMIATDEALQIERLRRFDLVDDVTATDGDGGDEI